MNWRVSLDPREGGGLSNSNLVQQGAELAYLLRHDPEFRGVRKEHRKEAGKRVRLKNNGRSSGEISSIKRVSAGYMAKLRYCRNWKPSCR